MQAAGRPARTLGGRERPPHPSAKRLACGRYANSAVTERVHDTAASHARPRRRADAAEQHSRTKPISKQPCKSGQ